MFIVIDTVLKKRVTYLENTIIVEVFTDTMVPPSIFLKNLQILGNL